MTEKAYNNKTIVFNKYLLFIHIAVLLFGLSGLFAKIIHQSANIIVLGRVFFSIIFLYLIIKIKKFDTKLEKKKDYGILLLTGIVLALHWSFFMKSIQISTVAIGTLTFSTFPLFVTFLEPLFFKEKIKLENIICSVVMFAGIIFIIPEFKLENTATQGVMYGMAGSLTYAVFSLINRNLTQKNNVIIIAFYEQAVTTIVLFPFVFIERPVFTIIDIIGLAVLGILFTAFAHSLFIEGLKNVKVHTAGIISSLESVYGILAALLFFKEMPGIKEITGGIIILIVVFYSTIKSNKIIKK